MTHTPPAPASAPTETDQDQQDKVERQQAQTSRWFVTLVLLGALLVLYFLLPPLSTAEFILLIKIFIITLGSLMPWLIYQTFAVGRLPTLFNEYKQNLRRLGLTDRSKIYNDKFKVLYGQHDARARVDFATPSPVLISVLLSLAGWLVVFLPLNLNQAVLAPNSQPIAYGFLGAYVFGLGALARQYVTDDLQPRYYASLNNRFLTVFVLSWLIWLMIPAENDLGPFTTTQAQLVVAFFVGLFPNMGLRIIQRVSVKILGKVTHDKGFEEDFPLSLLDGLNAYHEDRLLIEGIENLQNLASANIVDLMLRTRYPVEQIIDWMDQALLRLHARNRMDDFMALGLRTATDFTDAFEPLGLVGESLLARQKAVAQSLARRTSQTAEGGTPAQLNPDEAAIEEAWRYLTTIFETLRFDPNMFHVRYWRRHEYQALPEDVERDRTSADVKLMQGFHDDAIADYTRLFQEIGNYNTALFYRGLAYYAKGELVRATQDYHRAIEMGGSEWELLCHAYVELGRVARDQNHLGQAIEHYQAALRYCPKFSEALFELAYIYVRNMQRYEEAVNLFEGIVKTGNKFKEAEVYANLGNAYFEWAKQLGDTNAVLQLNKAQNYFQQAILIKPTLFDPHWNLAWLFEYRQDLESAIATLNTALVNIDETNDPESAYRVRLLRGNMYLRTGRLADAIEDYRAATELPSKDAAAFYNLGVALQQDGDMTQAQVALEAAIALNPGHILAHQLLGNVYQAQRRFQPAADHYHRVVELARESDDQPAQAQAQFSLGEMYHQQERFEDAQRSFSQAMALGDDDTYTWAVYQLGLVQFDAGDFEGAVRQLSNAAALFDLMTETEASVDANVHLGQAYQAVHDLDAAATALNMARTQLDQVYNPALPEHKRLSRQLDQLQQSLAA